MLKTISKKNKNTRKNKSLTQKKLTQKGGKIYKIPTIYRNIKYSKSKTNFSISELKCSICRENLFKLRTMKIATFSKAIFLDGNFFDNRFKFFTCTNCGKVEIFSNRIIETAILPENDKITKN